MPLAPVVGTKLVAFQIAKIRQAEAGHAFAGGSLVLAAEADGGTVLTVEGLAVDGRLSALQQAFLDTGAAQCGFCIPGQLLASHALLALTPHPDRALPTRPIHNTRSHLYVDISCGLVRDGA